MPKKGTVKWFNERKGHGFIVRDEDEPDIFVHYSGIFGEGYKNLEANQRVSFEIRQGRKGPEAYDVKVIKV